MRAAFGCLIWSSHKKVVGVTCNDKLSFSGSLEEFEAGDARDIGKGSNGLHALRTEGLGEDLRQRALLMFGGRRISKSIFCRSSSFSL
jgi:hypothetical protein